MSDSSFVNEPQKKSDHKVFRVPVEVQVLPRRSSNSPVTKETTVVEGGGGGGFTSKSSSTKSKQSTVSSSVGVVSVVNGYSSQVQTTNNPHSTILKQESTSTPSTTSLILNQPHPPTSWIEQIQFKAQYYHFRCNDYVSVINSVKARSLDKVEGLGTTTTTTTTTKQKIQQQGKDTDQPISSSTSSQQTTNKASCSVSNLPQTSTSHPLFCWNFPRVKLRKLFNAKSLDNIVVKDQSSNRGRQSLSAGQKETARSHSQSRTCEIGDNNTKITVGGGSSSVSGNNKPGPSSKTKPAQSSSASATCKESAHQNIRKLKYSSSSSSSEYGGIGSAIKSGRSASVGPTSATSAHSTNIKNSQQGHQDTGTSNNSTQRSDTFAVVATKSDTDTCINRVQVVQNPSSSVLVGVPCCSSIINYFSNSRTSVDNLDLVSSDPVQIPAAVVKVAPTKKKITFGKSVNKITPLNSPDDYEEDVDYEQLTMSSAGVANGNAISSSSKPRLVVTSVNYLQGPIPISSPISQHENDNNSFQQQQEVTSNNNVVAPSSSSSMQQGPRKKYHEECSSSSSSVPVAVSKYGIHVVSGTNANFIVAGARRRGLENVQPQSQKFGQGNSSRRNVQHHSSNRTRSLSQGPPISSRNVSNMQNGNRSPVPSAPAPTTPSNNRTNFSDLKSPEYVKRLTKFFESKMNVSNSNHNHSTNTEIQTTTGRKSLEWSSSTTSYAIYQGVNVKSSPGELNLYERYRNTKDPEDDDSENRTSIRIPIHVERSIKIPIQEHVERSIEIPIQHEHVERSFEIPIQVEKSRTRISNESTNGSMSQASIPVTAPQTQVVEKNGRYFLQEVEKEKINIEKLVQKAAAQLETLDPSSDESGRIRAAIGKAKLLISKKFKQFEGLCETNLKEQNQGASGEQPTTQNDDLAGFWDMVLIQVNQIYLTFEELENPLNQQGLVDLVDSPYQRPTPMTKKESTSTRKLASLSSSKSTPLASKQKSNNSSAPLNASRDESRRKLLAERRKAMKSQTAACNGSGKSDNPDIQIFVL